MAREFTTRSQSDIADVVREGGPSHVFTLEVVSLYTAIHG